MTDAERAALHSLALAVRDLQSRLGTLEAFAVNLLRRIQLHEAGLAVYQIDDRRDVH